TSADCSPVRRPILDRPACSRPRRSPPPHRQISSSNNLAYPTDALASRPSGVQNGWVPHGREGSELPRTIGGQERGPPRGILGENLRRGGVQSQMAMVKYRGDGPAL